MPQWKTRPHKYANDESEGTITEIRIADKDSSISTTTGNRLFFYGNVSEESALLWNKQLDDTSRNMKIIQLMYDLPTPPPINIFIQSNGGEVFAALSTLGRIQSLKKDGQVINTTIEGFCASAATLISVMGSTRYIRKYSCMMIHQLSSNFWGNYQEFQDEQKNVELIMGIITNIYKNTTKMDIDALRETLKHDLYLPVESCLAWGLVDTEI